MRRVLGSLLLLLAGSGALAAAPAHPPAPEGWRSTTGGAVRILHPPGAEQLAAPLSREAPRFLAEAGRRLGTEPEGPFFVYLAPDRRSRAALGGVIPRGPEWAAGYTFSGAPVAVIHGETSRGPLLSGMLQIFRHELVHLLMNEAL